ncbi:MAG: citrate (Si)-synthase [Deltaproteobacteria bacterium]|nr:citrate (Si)-synthase [Deltaproteobacteria bacterium]MBW2154336.1 citrate (Si)-synthase [Deltaproteobacteria bacterium]
MEECRPILNIGLRGFTVATTRISHVDKAAEKLIYRGYSAKELAENSSFEEVVFLLIYERLPSPVELKAFKDRLAQERAIPPQVIAALQTRPHNAFPMDILQSAIAMLAHHDSQVTSYSKKSSEDMGIRLIAKFPTIVAAWDRIRNNKEPINPSSKLNHAGNFLYMLSGDFPQQENARFFDICLILHAEHSFNASTFAARQVASTRAHIYASVAAAVGALSGELHGGANARAMEMLKKIGSVEAVEDYINQEFDAGRKIFGLGHAVYKGDDPRAEILAPMSKALGERTGKKKWYEISKEVEKKGKEAFRKRKGREIFVNVDFWSASVYHAMGIPVDLFTPVFAIARISGWVAHVIEEQFAGAAPEPVLYRPDSEYIGDYCGPDECPYVPIAER